MNYINTFTLLILLLTCNSLRAQDIPASYTEEFSFKNKQAHSAYLNIYNYNYTRNYEYFNRFADGYTLFGTQLIPSFTWMADEHLAITGGAWLKNDFGNNGHVDLFPYFNIRYHKNNWTLINGALEYRDAHRYPEVLYHSERIITKDPEYGTQFKLNNERFYLDAWINWMKMIYKPSPVQEEIMGGLSSEWTILKKNTNKLSIPLQGIAYHKGGQIDTLHVPLTSLYNVAAGLKIEHSLEGFIQKVELQASYIYSKDFSFTKQQPFSSGSGIYSKAKMNMRHIGDLGIAYWQGNAFQSIAGAPIFQSVSSQINNSGYTEKERELLFISLDNHFALSPAFYIGLRLEPVIDLNHPAFEFSNSLYLIYRDNFLLKKKK